jgi:hypothetical protein
MEQNVYSALQSALLGIASRAAQSAAYEGWSDTFARQEVREVWRSEGSKLQITIAQLKKLSAEELISLGFNLWDDGHRLIPLWAFNFITDGEELVSISGDTRRKNSAVTAAREYEHPEYTDLDVRFGCIAWGFMEDAK